jgi:hypothetical protein
VSSPAQRTPDGEEACEVGEAPDTAAGGEDRQALPVLVRATEIERARSAPRSLARERSGAGLPAMQAAAVAAGSFVAGAAVAGLVHSRRRRSAAVQGSRAGRALARSSRKRGRTTGEEMLQIVSSRTLLVDVHVLGIPHLDR